MRIAGLEFWAVEGNMAHMLGARIQAEDGIANAVAVVKGLEEDLGLS
jgi:hypothetical protein